MTNVARSIQLKVRGLGAKNELLLIENCEFKLEIAQSQSEMKIYLELTSTDELPSTRVHVQENTSHKNDLETAQLKKENLELRGKTLHLEKSTVMVNRAWPPRVLDT